MARLRAKMVRLGENWVKYLLDHARKKHVDDCRERWRWQEEREFFNRLYFSAKQKGKKGYELQCLQRMKSNIISQSAASIKQWSKVKVRILLQLQRELR